MYPFSLWTRWRYLLGAGLIGAASLMLSAGCRDGSRTGGASGLTATVFIDLSDSTLDLRRDMHRAADQLADALPSGTRMRVFSFASSQQADPLFDLKVTGAEDVHQVLGIALNAPAGRRGTFGAPALRRALIDAQRAHKKRQPMVLLLLTEGGFDDLAAMHPLADKLAAYPEVVAVGICPISAQPQIAGRVETAFGTFGDRLILSSQATSAQAVARLADTLRENRK